MSAAKLPILNTNEFDLWKMRIEQYYLITNYSLWEVILNGDSPAPTRVIEGIIQPIAPTTTKQSQSNSLELDNDDLKQIDADDLEEMDLKWQMVMSPKDTRRNVVAEPQKRNVLVETSTSNALVSQYDGVGLESVEARLLVYQKNESVFEEDIKLLKLEVQLRDNALVVFRQKFKKAEQERDDLKLKLEKFQTSSNNLSQLLASQTNDKTGLGYNTQVFTSSMFDYDEMLTSETDDSLHASPKYD
nr:ribonuclease H-like domain-containing protein [Tanacetum cinerariifolium]